MSHHHRRNSAAVLEEKRRQENRLLAVCFGAMAIATFAIVLFGKERGAEPEGPLTVETVGEAVLQNPLAAYASGFAEKREAQLKDIESN